MEFKGTKTKKGELKWIRSGMGFQVLTADSYYSVCEAVGKRGQEEQVANAQLIATAPELLSIISRIVEHDGKISDIKAGTGEIAIHAIKAEELYEEARKIISKALGKEAGDE